MLPETEVTPIQMENKKTFPNYLYILNVKEQLLQCGLDIWEVVMIPSPNLGQA